MKENFYIGSEVVEFLGVELKNGKVGTGNGPISIKELGKIIKQIVEEAKCQN